ncbi:hypothetical protein FOCC_FOCC013768 [Frankliniella occidentalis]|nr:hypothetical protein FOCC_FOCC013768 [Frankliniella occidentalis]
MCTSVIDFELLSKYCHICAIITIAGLGEDTEAYKTWYKSHIDLGECSQSLTGASGNMEREGAVILWKRSELECNMRYTKYVSDGDAKSLSAINEAQPHGPDVLVEKEECINHVGKRLGTALRNTIANSSKLGVTLGGKGEGALTQAKVDTLQKYYQKAMIENAPDKAKAATSRSKPSHSVLETTRNKKVFKAILPTYERLSETELVTRWKDFLTQNANESLHNVIWSYVPNINFVSKGRLELGATQAVGKYNMDLSTMGTIEANLTERPASAQSMRNADEVDRKRLAQSDKQAEVETKKTRSSRKRAKNNKKTGKKDNYAPGGGD